MNAIVLILFQGTVAMTQLLDKEHRMLRAPPNLTYVAFMLFYFKSVARTWICGKQPKGQHF